MSKHTDDNIVNSTAVNCLQCESIGQAWLESCSYIFRNGQAAKDGDVDIKELLHFVLTIENPRDDDKIIEKFGDKEMLNWMLSNFLEQKRVPELKNALSYGTRLFNYNGKNQVEWVIKKLSDKKETKAATIPLIIPNEDEGYIPCVSMLDFKIRNNKLMIVAMCRSIDFGKKVYANMVALNKIQSIVSERLKISNGPIVMYVVSAHIYDDDYKKLDLILKKYKTMA